MHSIATLLTKPLYFCKPFKNISTKKNRTKYSPDGGGSGNNENKGNSNESDDPRPPFMRQQTTGGSVKGPPPRQNTITRRRLRAPVWASRTAKYSCLNIIFIIY